MKSQISIQKFKNKKILLLTHENADLDAFCSTAIFQKYFKKNKIPSVIAIPSHINEQTLEFAFKEKISFQKNPNLENFDTICIFDFNDYEQLGVLRKIFVELRKKKKFEVITFDHHEKEKRSIANGFINPNALSTTQILFDLFGKEFDKKMSAYACLGMLEDTGRFLVGDKSFFNAFSKCLDNSEKTYAELFGLAKHKAPEGEQIAFMKAIQRAKINKIKDIIIITSQLGFYQGAAATKLLEFGAQISLVVGKEKKGSTHLSGRADTTFKEQKNFNLMKDLFIPLQKIFSGEVGGHSGAAQWKGKANENNVLKEALKILEKKLN